MVTIVYLTNVGAHHAKVKRVVNVSSDRAESEMFRVDVRILSEDCHPIPRHGDRVRIDALNVLAVENPAECGDHGCPKSECFGRPHHFRAVAS